MTRIIASLLAIFVCSSILAGCSGSDKSSSTAANRMVFKEQKENLRFDNTGMKRQVFDMNSDGQVDLWKFYAYKKASDEEGEGELIIVRKELDLNFDGVVDRIMYYNQKENLMREEIDTNFDGIVDRIHYYDNGLVIKTEFYQEDCNRFAIDEINTAEVHPNLVRVFRQGVLTREEVDVSCDGKREVVTVFNAEGDIVQIGMDENSDGIIEKWLRF